MGEELSQTEVVGMDEGAEQMKVNAMEVLEKEQGANPAVQNAKNQPARAETKEELQAKKDKAAAKSAKAKEKKAAKKQEKKAKEKKADKKAAAEAKNKDKKSSPEGGGLPRSDLNWKNDEQKKNQEVARQLAAEKAARAKKALPKKGLKGKTKNAADEREKAKLEDHKGEAAEEQREKEQAEKRRKEGHIPPRGAEDATAKKRREQTPTIVDPVKTKVIHSYESLLKAHGLDEYDNFKQKPNRAIKKKDKKNDMAKSDALTIAQRRMSRAQNKNGRGSACADGDCPPRESRNGAPYVKGMNNAFKTQPPPTIVKKHPPKFEPRKPPCPHQELGLEHDVEDFLLD